MGGYDHELCQVWPGDSGRSGVLRKLPDRNGKLPRQTRYGGPYSHPACRRTAKEACEKDIQALLEEYKIDVVCMARYMQILTPEFTRRWENKVINIHHGFLPAFKGAKPYDQAWRKGVKMIGATAHFANEDLDQGPIIFQDVVRVKDTNSIHEFVEIGKDVERRVLVEGLKKYFNHNVFICNGRTFVIEQ